MSDWEILVKAKGMDTSADINEAVTTLVSEYGGGTVLLEPEIYYLAHSITRASNVTIKGAFNGANCFDGAVALGTILKWAGPPGFSVVYDAPMNGRSVINNGGVENLSIDGSGIASIGLASWNAFYAHYSKLHCIGVRDHAYYFSSQGTGPNYHPYLDSITAALIGGANGIVLDGPAIPGSNTCFLSARNCHITFQNGCAYALCNADDCGFSDCASSMIVGGSGYGIYFGGSEDTGGVVKAAYGNRFIGWNSGNEAPIAARGGAFPSRGNYVLCNAVDGQPIIYQSSSATLTVEAYDGEAGFNGFLRNPLKVG